MTKSSSSNHDGLSWLTRTPLVEEMVFQGPMFHFRVNMEPEHRPLEDHFPLQPSGFQVRFQGVVLYFGGARERLGGGFRYVQPL